MKNQKIYSMSFAKVYPLYIAKAEKKGRTKEEINEENKIKKETVSAEVNTESELIEKEGEKIKEINSMEEEEQAMK